MKNKLLIGIFAMLSVLNLTSCDTEPIDPNIVVPDPTDPVEAGSFKVKIDGVQYTALATQAYISGGSILMTATRANGDSFGFIIGGTTEGTYAANQNILAFTQGGSEFGWEGTNPANAGENTGAITISSVNATTRTISGTFQFKGYWSDTTNTTVAPKEFTEGVFTNIPYTDQSPTGDTFTANVDGAAYDASDIFVTEAGSGGTNIISISAPSGNANLTVAVMSDITVGNYPITGSIATDDVQVMYMNTSGAGGPATSGAVNITQKTADRIRGTFTATVTSGSTTFQITQGNFDVAY
ncbi:DUF6252 family protein [Flavobacterium selenitireducens]|uniref:DUF6252 family protein n=1 Tax=Flavobacterium selenitireducens TaxID=2722704 RepID=UPI00168A52F5|nr:DUF6252 family protein [Flavobacterium selenitireducens]MBD3580889.1 hypothetical protein [Flavobacterium selenitireducens]